MPLRHHVALSWTRLVFPSDPLCWLGFGTDGDYGTPDCDIPRLQVIEATALAFHKYYTFKDVVPLDGFHTNETATRVTGAARLALRA